MTTMMEETRGIADELKQRLMKSGASKEEIIHGLDTAKQRILELGIQDKEFVIGMLECVTFDVLREIA